jgi:2-dehydropantoate 2-reductase
MGSLYGGLLARAGSDVTLVDTWAEHIEAIRRGALHLDGITGDLRIPIRATTRAQEVTQADVAIVLVDAASTRDAAVTAAQVLMEDGYAITLQNGIGNIEALTEVLGAGRVLAGLSYHSAALQAAGHVTHTHTGPTWIGELDGTHSPRLQRLHETLEGAGFSPVSVDDIQGFIWAKFVHNCAINAICAVTGLRVGEIPQNPGVDLLQTKVIEEALAVVSAKGITLPEAEPMQAIKDFCQIKFNKPSMLQHVEQGKRTEIDALNGAIVREGLALGVPTPYNEALTWLTKAVEQRMHRVIRGQPIDYDRLEAEAKRRRGHGPTAGTPARGIVDRAGAAASS